MEVDGAESSGQEVGGSQAPSQGATPEPEASAAAALMAAAEAGAAGGGGGSPTPPLGTLGPLADLRRRRGRQPKAKAKQAEHASGLPELKVVEDLLERYQVRCACCAVLWYCSTAWDVRPRGVGVSAPVSVLCYAGRTLLPPSCCPPPAAHSLAGLAGAGGGGGGGAAPRGLPGRRLAGAGAAGAGAGFCDGCAPRPAACLCDAHVCMGWIALPTARLGFGLGSPLGLLP